MSQNTWAADTPRDSNFVPQPSAHETPTPPATISQHPDGMPVGPNLSVSALRRASNSQDAPLGSPVSPTLDSTNASSQLLLDGSTTSPTSTRSDSESLFSSGRPRNLSLSQSPWDLSRSGGACQAPAKKKVKDFVNFLTIKEPSTKALEEFAEQQRRELKERGLQHPFGISTSKLPEHVPRVNTKWDGLPDDKRDAILAAEKRKKKKAKTLADQRRRNMSTGNQGEAALDARHCGLPFVPPNSHRSRHSIGSANTHTAPSSNSESYKSSNPNAGRPQARRSSAVPSLAGSAPASASTDGSVASPSRYSKFNRPNDDRLARSDSDLFSSPDESTPYPRPFVSSTGRRKSVPIIVPLMSPPEDGMHNVAPLLPFMTETIDLKPEVVTRRPDTGVNMRSTDNTGSAFLAGESTELDISDDPTDEGYTTREAKSTDIQPTLP